MYFYDTILNYVKYCEKICHLQKPKVTAPVTVDELNVFCMNS